MSRLLNSYATLSDIDDCTLEELQKDLFLRPQYLNEYLGQEELKENLKIFIGAAKARDECLDHILLYGPPGLGKTTLAFIIANEMETDAHVVHGGSIEKTGDLASVLSSLEAGDILFIDEIHRLPKVVEEILYSAMEDFTITIMMPRENCSKAVSLTIPPFTLIGATTRAGNLSSPLRARFGIVEKLNYYKIEELTEIIIRTAKVYDLTIDEDAAKEIAKRSRQTPRIANRIFKRVRDFANYESRDHIDLNDVNKAFHALKVDDIGLDDVDLRYLRTLIKRFNGGPIGLETLASTIGEEATNLEDVYEPYLLRIGFINRTPRGRVATEKAYKHLHILKKSPH